MPITIILTSEEKDFSKLQEVKEVLESIPGKFFAYQIKKGSKGAFIAPNPGLITMTEKEFFHSMSDFRRNQDLGSSDYLVFLTSRKIANGHFNGIDFDHKNIFLDLNNWGQIYLKGSPDKYPIAFHVLISILITYYFPDESAAKEALHWVDKGCILDFNGQKEKVDLKLLTARICPDCLDRLLAYNPDPNLLAYFRSGLEKIRHDIVEGEYYRKIQPKPVRVLLQTTHNKKMGYQLFFEGIGTLDLDAIHLTVYLYFLKKKGGIYLKQIQEDYHFLYGLYDMLLSSSNESKTKVRTLDTTILKLCMLKEENGVYIDFGNNALSERLAKINKEITILLGTFGLHEFFQILRRDNEKHGVKPEIEFIDGTTLLQQVEQSSKTKPRIKVVRKT